MICLCTCTHLLNLIWAVCVWNNYWLFDSLYRSLSSVKHIFFFCYHFSGSVKPIFSFTVGYWIRYSWIEFITEKNKVYFPFLTHFSSMFHFYTPWKRQKTSKTFGFLTFSGGVEMEHWLKWVKLQVYGSLC